MLNLQRADGTMVEVEEGEMDGRPTFSLGNLLAIRMTKGESPVYVQDSMQNRAALGIPVSLRSIPAGGPPKDERPAGTVEAPAGGGAATSAEVEELTRVVLDLDAKLDDLRELTLTESKLKLFVSEAVEAALTEAAAQKSGKKGGA